MRRLVWVLFFFIALLPAAAEASPPSKWVSAELPMRPSAEHHHAVVPLEAPSKEHPLGTVAIIGRDHIYASEIDDNEYVLWAYAWDLAAKRVIAKKRLGRMDSQGTVVSAVRAGDRILVAAGSNYEDPLTEVVLFTLDEALDVVSREPLGKGIRPSLAVSGAWIVAGFFEHRTTDLVAVNPKATRPPPQLSLAFHAVVLDRASHIVAGARVFQGQRLLFPDSHPRFSMRAIALRDGRAYLSLPGLAEATIVAVKLPSLVQLKTRLLDGFQAPSGSAPIFSVDRNVVVVTPQGWRVLSPELENIALVPVTGYSMEWNPRRATLLESAPNSTRAVPWHVVHSEDCDQVLWAWDRPVAMCEGVEDENVGEPMRIFYRP